MEYLLPLSKCNPLGQKFIQLTCILLFVCCLVIFEREGDRARVGEGQREREGIPGRLHTVSTEPNTGLELTNREIMT